MNTTANIKNDRIEPTVRALRQLSPGSQDGAYIQVSGQALLGQSPRADQVRATVLPRKAPGGGVPRLCRWPDRKTISPTYNAEYAGSLAPSMLSAGYFVLSLS